jgi:hypothetical protein
LAHLLTGLQSIGLVEQVDDALRDKRSVFKITEPIVRLHQLITQRREPELVSGQAARVWRDNADTVAAKIYGPHFEDLARQWCFLHASRDTLGGSAGVVRPSTLGCRTHRQGHELDLVVTETNSFAADRIVAIGEAKGTLAPMDVPQLERLEHLRTLLPAARMDGPPKLLLFARAGFTGELAGAAAGRADVELVDLNRLYRGE